jgi:hypothetical protein
MGANAFQIRIAMTLLRYDTTVVAIAVDSAVL